MSAHYIASMLTLWTLLLACGAPETGALRFEGDAPRNVLMISVDTLRRDAVGHYGGGSDTPTIDRLLEEGLSLERHRSCSSWTYGSAICALGGRTGVDFGFVPGGDDRRTPLPQDIKLLPYWLRQAGLRTALVTGNYYIGTVSNIARFYDVVVERHEGVATELVDRALETWDGLGPAPWFLHVHLFDPHSWYDPPAQYLVGLDALPEPAVDLSAPGMTRMLGDIWEDFDPAEQAVMLEHLRLRYSGEARYVDDQIARLLEGLEARGALADTLVVFWSDHGEQFGEHGDFDHGDSLHYGEVDASAGFWAAGLEPGRWEGATTHADLAPTLLAALGIERPEGLTGLALGIDPPGGRPCFALRRGDLNQQSVDADGLRLSYRWDGGLSLYDIAADPLETTDRFDPTDPRVRALWSLLEPRVQALDALVPEHPSPPDLAPADPG